MLRPYLKIWEWEWIFGRAVKVISSLGVRSPWIVTIVVRPFLVIFLPTTLISFTKLRFSGHFEVFYFKDINVVGGKMTSNGHKMRKTINYSYYSFR